MSGCGHPAKTRGALLLLLLLPAFFIFFGWLYIAKNAIFKNGKRAEIIVLFDIFQ
jgi:hypothetical protein